MRLQADQGNFTPLAEVENIHVLAGALKLFFRELKEPLIPWDTVEKLLPIINLPNNQVFFSILSLMQYSPLNKTLWLSESIDV